MPVPSDGRPDGVPDSRSGGRHPAARPPRRDRLVALFLLGLIAFNPPLLKVFGVGGILIAGWPLLYVYIFAAWAVVVVLLALSVESRGAPPP